MAWQSTLQPCWGTGMRGRLKAAAPALPCSGQCQHPQPSPASFGDSHRTLQPELPVPAQALCAPFLHGRGLRHHSSTGTDPLPARCLACDSAQQDTWQPWVAPEHKHGA